MNWLRLAILVLGPIPILAASLWLTSALRGATAVPLDMNHVVRTAEPVESPELAALDGDADEGESPGLADRCRLAAERLSDQLGPECRVVVRPPFVVGGDLEAGDLERWYRRTISPAAQALATSYFSAAPSEPVCVLLFADEGSYSRHARGLYGDEGVSVYGYYKPRLRTLVINISTGGGTLVHELTHALMDFDFPAVPDWFNEGLASLHEQCRFRDDGSGIDGLENWRLPILQEAIDRERLRSLESLIADDDFRQGDVGLNYAQARYFCLYLQRHGLLETYFHRFRANQADDPLGIATVSEVLPDKSWHEIDDDFRRWALDLKW